MNRFVAISSLVVLSCAAGVLTTSFGEQVELQREFAWEPTKVPDRTLETSAVQWIVDSPRWEIVDESGQSNQAIGDFAEGYRLVAITRNSSRTYALLEAARSTTVEGEAVSKVAVGDQLSSGWIITEIGNATVVATREGESQSVELFPEI